MSEGETHWGFHLLVDAGGCNEDINNPHFVKQFIARVVRAIGMQPIGPPMVVYVENLPEGKGVSAVQLITTSTITFHGDDDGKKLFLDIFSCKTFNKDVVLTMVRDWFHPKVLHERLIYRDVENTVASGDASLSSELPTENS
jgi:S-adenosylmethionine/arginine decarboxylase-like enzyme